MTAEHDALAFAARHINASARDQITEEALLHALVSDSISTGLGHHLRAFFDETDVETFSDLARSGLVSYAQLAAGARRFLPNEHDTRRWLDERA